VPVNTSQQTLKIYQLDPDSTVVSDMFMAQTQVERLTHVSRLPGGFWTLKFSLPMTDQQYWDWRINRQLYRVVLEGQAKKTIWEGRLEGISGPINNPTLEFRGYWSNFEDAVSNNATYIPLNATTADAILKDMLDTGFHADTEQVRTHADYQTNISAPGVTITQVWPKDFSLWRVLTDAGTGVLTYADSSNNIVDFAVWEDRVVYLTSRNPTAVTWKSYRGRGVRGGLPLRTQWRRLYNAVSTLYDGTTESARSTDSASIEKYIRREQVIANIGSSTAAVAVSRSDADLARKKDIQQELDLLTLTAVWDANGIAQSICDVRAGDVLQIPDLIPTSTSLSGADLDALRTFVIEEVTCDHARGDITIRPDRSSKSLAALLARAHITT
jgi:hypothetical protein